QALPLRADFQEPRRGRRGFGGASALATDCIAHRAAARARGSGQLLALLRRERALHLLRHYPPGAGYWGARHRRKRSFHYVGALRVTLPVGDVAAPQSPRIGL